MYFKIMLKVVYVLCCLKSAQINYLYAVMIVPHTCRECTTLLNLVVINRPGWVPNNLSFVHDKCSAHGQGDRDIAQWVRGPGFDSQSRRYFSSHTG